jgi:glycosyltransferase involved in cell wall biosynthesis
VSEGSDNPAAAARAASAPLVSIGLPVRDGQRYVRAALESLLAQTLTDFEVIICDNNSNDDTPAICREYAARDSRIRYYRNDTDLGPAANHNRCFEYSRGKYFKWHAHDDLIAPDFLQKCVAVLEGDSQIVNCHTLTRVVDENGVFVRDYEFRTQTDSPCVSRRFGRLINVSHRQHVGYEIFGVWRRDALAQTPLEKADAHGDRILLVRMSLRGRFHEVREPLFFARAHAKQSMQAQTRRGRLSRWIGAGPQPPAEWWDESKRGKIVFPEWNLLAEYWSAIREVSNLSAGDRLRCRLWVMAWVLGNWHKLARDLALAIEHAMIFKARSVSEPSATSEPEPISTPRETAMARG